MDRRTFLKTVGVAAAAVSGGSLLSACSGGGNGIPEGPGTLNVQQATFELLTGEGRYVTFGVLDRDNVPIEDGAFKVYLRRAATPDQPEGGEILVGPLDATYEPASSTGIGVYYVQTDLAEPGTAEIAVVGEPGHGFALVQVVRPEDSVLPVPGDAATPAPTPTTENDLGYFSVCTQDPPCGMHGRSLDAALESGQPVVLMFATPAFCQTVVCGPSVATLEEIRTDDDWGDTIFIHSEIYAEEPDGANPATAPLVDAVQAWGLQSEPFLFTIDADATIVDRLDGPMVPSIVRAMVTQVSGG